MQEIFKLLIGIFFLILGFPIGNFLRSKTKEELKDGQIWFRILVFVGLIGGIVGLIIRNDVILFSMFFIAIVASRSLERNNENKGKR